MSQKSSKSKKKSSKNFLHQKLQKSYQKLEKCSKEKCNQKPEKDLKCAEKECPKEFKETVQDQFNFIVNSLEVSSIYNQLYAEIVSAFTVLTKEDQKEFSKYVSSEKIKELLEKILKREEENQKTFDELICLTQTHKKSKKKKSKKSKKQTQKKKSKQSKN